MDADSGTGSYEFSRTIISIAKSFYNKRVAQDQGGLLTGKDPSAFDTSDPLRLWIIQVGIIVMMTQLLSLGLRKMRQPKVIAEVLGGILLGPTVFGRIPGFTEHVFPQQSRPYLSLVADIGLCLFLFLVGLEIEGGVLKRNARLSATVATAGMAIPFGLGAALSVPLYNRFVDKSVQFTHFMLFTGVAYSITAFPVLCRILTELKLLDTTVGIVVLSAGVANDVIGWVLLALSVALVNAGSGLTALWILLICAGWVLILMFPVRFAMYWLARKTGSTENGPSTFYMTVTILVMFGSAFFTDIIGVNAIFGAFLAGLIVPREGGLAILLTEKLEDMVTIIFLPLYFTLSGLSTNLGLLNTGVIWGFTISICALAYTGKFGGCTLAARYAGFTWRESATVGTLMSCKGLIELIVLNVGLSAGILDQRVFSMFVLEALLLTCMTTPVVSVLYPPRYRVRVSGTGPNFNNVQDGAGADQAESGKVSSKSSREDKETDGFRRKTQFTVVLDKIEHLPGMMSLTQLIQPPPPPYPGQDKSRGSDIQTANPSLSTPDVTIDALRLIELSDRTSAVMKSSMADTLIHTDPILGVFRTFAELNGMSIGSSLAIVTFGDLASCVADHAKNKKSQLILVPWLPPYQSESNTGAGDTSGAATPRVTASTTNPFDMLFKAAGGGASHSASAVHSQFVRGVFAQSSSADVALYVDRAGHGPSEVRQTFGTTQHLFLPFFGGPDDRLALNFVVQLCSSPRITATVVKVTKREPTVVDDTDEDLQKPPVAYLGGGDHDHATSHGLTISSGTGFQDTVYAYPNTQTKLQSETADNVLWGTYASRNRDASVDSGLLDSALSRIEFLQMASPQPLHAVIQKASASYESAVAKKCRLLVVVGRSRRLAVENHHAELKELIEEYGNVDGEMNKTIGDVATALVVSGGKAGLVVLQAATVDLE